MTFNFKIYFRQCEKFNLCLNSLDCASIPPNSEVFLHKFFENSQETGVHVLAQRISFLKSDAFSPSPNVECFVEKCKWYQGIENLNSVPHFAFSSKLGSF